MMPRSTMSAASSGGVFSSVRWTGLYDGVNRFDERFADLVTGSRDYLRDPGDEVAPLDVHHPRVFASTHAVPTVNLTCSAVLSPISMLYFRLT